VPKIVAVSARAKVITMHSSKQQVFWDGMPVTVVSDSLRTCAAAIQERHTFRKLEEGAILDGENVSPFWNELSSRLSSGLSLPTMTDMDSREGDWLSAYTNTIESNAWFSATSWLVQDKRVFRVSCPTATVSVLGATVPKQVSGYTVQEQCL